MALCPTLAFLKKYFPGPAFQANTLLPHLPVYVGDVLCVYAEIEEVGRTSITVALESWVLRRRLGERVRVTEGRFVYVAIGEDGRPRQVPPEEGA